MDAHQEAAVTMCVDGRMLAPPPPPPPMAARGGDRGGSAAAGRRGGGTLDVVVGCGRLSAFRGRDGESDGLEKLRCEGRE